MKKIIIALALTATTALLAHEDHYNDHQVHSVYRVAPQVIYTQPRIAHVKPVPVYYAWNERHYERYGRDDRRYEHRHEYYEDRRDDRYGRDDRHGNDNRHDHR
jgi:hypothetical protein